MAVCPFAVWRPLPENNTQPRITPRVAILHSAAVAMSSLYNAFNRPGNNLESHFFVKKTGQIEQYIDTQRQADANRWANEFAASIETEDNGDPDHDPWTTAQLDSTDLLLRWLNAVHQIPLRRCDKWNGTGVGYHTMWGSPSPWTPVRKTCPGRVRVEQFDECVIPRLLKRHEQPPATATAAHEHEGEMSTTHDHRETLDVNGNAQWFTGVPWPRFISVNACHPVRPFADGRYAPGLEAQPVEHEGKIVVVITGGPKPAADGTLGSARVLLTVADG